MPNFTLTRSEVFFDGTGKPLKWLLQYSAVNFNLATVTAPFPVVTALQGFMQRYNTMVIEHIAVTDDAAGAGTTIMPTITPKEGVVGGFALAIVLEKQLFQFQSDTCQWDTEVPVLTQRLTIGDAWLSFAMDGYVATDDLTLMVWGRFQ